MPDSSVRVTRIVESVLERERQPEELTDALVLRLASTIQAKTPGLAGGVPRLVTEANMPTDRAKRHAWRLQGNRVLVDATVPDPPHPKQALLDAIDGAATVSELKPLMKRLVTGLLILVGGAFLLLAAAAPALALCTGTGDDTAEIQAMLPGVASLPRGSCMLGGTLWLPAGSILHGAGPDQTFLIPTTPGMSMIEITGTATIRDLNLGPLGPPLPMVLSAGITANGVFDRVRIDRVWVNGYFTSWAFAAFGGVASSSVTNSQFWNYQNGTWTVVLHQASDWTFIAVEAHEVQPSGRSGSSAVGFIESSSIRWFGGNIAGSNVLVNLSSASLIIFDGTTFYSDNGTPPACMVGLYGGSPPPAFRQNYVQPGAVLTC